MIKHGVELYLDIYNQWPSILQGCWIGLENISDSLNTTARLIKNNEFPEHTINSINYVPDVDDQISIFKYAAVDNKIIITHLTVNDEYKNQGVGRFFGFYMWTWIMENDTLPVYVPFTFRSDEIERIVSTLAVEHEVRYEILKKTDGSYLPLEEINNSEEIWGLTIAQENSF